MCNTSDLHRRAGGRRRYNSQRQQAAAHRRYRTLALLAEGRSQRQIAGELGVSVATVNRDAAFLGELVQTIKLAPDLAALGKPPRVKIGPRGWSFEAG